MIVPLNQRLLPCLMFERLEGGFDVDPNKKSSSKSFAEFSDEGAARAIDGNPAVGILLLIHLRKCRNICQTSSEVRHLALTSSLPPSSRFFLVPYLTPSVYFTNLGLFGQYCGYLPYEPSSQSDIRSVG